VSWQIGVSIARLQLSRRDMIDRRGALSEDRSVLGSRRDDRRWQFRNALPRMCVGRSRADTLLHHPQRAAVARSLCIGKSLPRARRSASSGRHGRCGARIQRGRAGSLV